MAGRAAIAVESTSVRSVRDGSPTRAAWVEIDLGAIRHNLRLIRSLAGSARVYAVCKGHAYGFDAVTIATLAASEGIDALACGDPDDARRIREAGIALPILLYGSTTADALPSIARLDVTVTAHDEATLQACLAHGLAFSLKLDAGFHRLGFRESELAIVEAAAREHTRRRPVGVYTHLTDAEDAPLLRAQVERFQAMVARVADAGWSGLERMVASSRVLIAAPELALDAVNPGRLVYGMLEPPWREQVDARDALAAVKARIIALKRVAAGAPLGYGGSPAARASLLAVIPFGFGDGYPRLPAGGSVLVRGTRAPLLGPRHTEHSIVDVTGIAGVAIGDEVVLVGRQGDAIIRVDEIAAATGVPLIELLPRLAGAAGSRRVFVGETHGLEAKH